MPGGFSPGNEQPGPINAVPTETETSKGAELELSAQPFRNWNISLNYSTTKAIKTAIDPATVSFMTALNTFFNGPGGQLRQWYNGGPAIGPSWQQNVYAPYLTEVAEQGQSAPDLPKFNLNLVTTYNVDRGPLKGVIVGGGFRDEGARILGYQFNQALNGGSGGLDVTKPWMGPTDSHVDLWFGYQRGIRQQDQLAHPAQPDQCRRKGPPRRGPIRAGRKPGARPNRKRHGVEPHELVQLLGVPPAVLSLKSGGEGRRTSCFGRQAPAPVAVTTPRDRGRRSGRPSGPRGCSGGCRFRAHRQPFSQASAQTLRRRCRGTRRGGGFRGAG